MKHARKLLYRIALVLALLFTASFAMYYDAFHTAPSRFMVRYETLSSVFIPEQMNDVSILAFSDLKFGPFMDQKRLEKLMDVIRSLSPDVVVFVGDLLDEQTPADEDTVALFDTCVRVDSGAAGKVCGTWRHGSSRCRYAGRRAENPF